MGGLVSILSHFRKEFEVVPDLSTYVQKVEIF